MINNNLLLYLSVFVNVYHSNFKKKKLKKEKEKGRKRGGYNGH